MYIISKCIINNRRGRGGIEGITGEYKDNEMSGIREDGCGVRIII